MPSASNSVPVGRTPLKNENRAALIGVLGLNLVALILIVTTGQLVAPGFDDFVKQWRDLLPAGVGVVFAGVVNGLLSSDNKARLVFWRWSNPLPGSFAFSRYAPRDSRIDLAALRRAVGAWPSRPRDQNTKWYRLFKTVENDPAVIDAHRHFLLTRDYTSIAFLLLLTATPLGFWFMASIATASAYAALLLLQYLLARQAAYNYGMRLVTTVLALKACSR